MQIYSTTENIYGDAGVIDRVGTNMLNIEINNASTNAPLSVGKLLGDKKVSMFLHRRGMGENNNNENSIISAMASKT